MTVQEALELIRNAVYGEEVRGAICDAIEVIDNVAENLVPIFDETTTYEIDDLVFYEDNIYKFTQAHTGAWSASDVEQTTVADELKKAERVKDYALAAFPTDIASGSIVTIPDGADNTPVKSMIVDIEPQQDLHGYDYPWPSGGGPNFASETGAYSDFDEYYIDSSTHKIVSAGSNFHRCILIPCTASKKYIIQSGAATVIRASAYNATPTASATPTAYVNADPVTSVPTKVEITTTASSSYILVQLFADSDKSGSWSGYTDAQMYEIATTGLYFSWDSNIAPISGWTGAEIYDTGINIWDEKWEVGAYSPSGVKITDSSVRSANMIAVKPSTVYKIVSPATLWICEYDKDKTFIRRSSYQSAITVSANTYYIAFNTASSYGTTYNNNISLNYPSTDIIYHSGVDNTTYTVMWQDKAGTVYFGTLYVHTGVLIVTKVGINMGSITWTYIVDSGLLFGEILSMKDMAVRTMAMFCSIYPVISDGRPFADVPDKSLWNRSNPRGVLVKDSSYTDASTFMTAVNDQTLVFDLSTPLTYQLDPIEVATLFGNNNMWANCGPLTLNYRADPSKYIAKKFAELPNAQG